MLIARIYEVFPLLCPKCGGQMRLIAFIPEGTQTDKILDHIGVDSKPPHISPARGPPLWDDCDAHVGEGVAAEPDWDLTCEQRILAVYRPGTALLRARRGFRRGLRALPRAILGLMRLKCLSVRVFYKQNVPLAPVGYAQAAPKKGANPRNTGK